jgi:catechol 2,3-dioxygenase-like lactoylglutathione lyase family enzyme
MIEHNASSRAAMTITLDHLIVPVNDAAASAEFYTQVLGFIHEAPDPPFEVLRVSSDLTLQLGQWGTDGGMHLAFAMSHDEFLQVFDRVRDFGIGWGGSFHSVGKNDSPGIEQGAQGPAPSLYFFDPNKHLLEIRHYSLTRDELTGSASG